MKHPEGQAPTLDRIRESHSMMEYAEARGDKHVLYRQGHDERCYICSLLTDVASLRAELQEVERERERYRDALEAAEAHIEDDGPETYDAWQVARAALKGEREDGNE